MGHVGSGICCWVHRVGAECLWWEQTQPKTESQNMRTATPTLECPNCGVVAIENAVFRHSHHSTWTARFTGETHEVPTGEVDANGDDIYEPWAIVEPVDVIDESQSYSINCSTCDATLEPEVWHVLDTFENMFFQKN